MRTMLIRASLPTAFKTAMCLIISKQGYQSKVVEFNLALNIKLTENELVLKSLSFPPKIVQLLL